ncbi:hypothetical protein EJB05_03978, partial [Eragrostis curvula]
RCVRFVEHLRTHGTIICSIAQCPDVFWALVDEDITELIATLRFSDPMHRIDLSTTSSAVNRLLRDWSLRDSKQNTRQWIAPKPGQLKINTDAAVAETKSHSAVAAICRGDQGEFIAASVRLYQTLLNLKHWKLWHVRKR